MTGGKRKEAPPVGPSGKRAKTPESPNGGKVANLTVEQRQPEAVAEETAMRTALVTHAGAADDAEVPDDPRQVQATFQQLQTRRVCDDAGTADAPEPVPEKEVGAEPGPRDLPTRTRRRLKPES